MSKKKKTILITGASSGIGRETAIRLAKEGHTVFAGIRRKVDKTEIESLNPNIKGLYIDITNQSSIDKAFWFVLKNTDKLDVLINNAGFAIAAPVEFLNLKNLKEQFDVNTFGAVAVTQKFLQLLSHGKIINISSMASYGLFPYISPYCASKRALDILMNSFALENKSDIKVISVKPASIKTPIWEKSIEKADETFQKLHESDKLKYQKEYNYLKNQALKSSRKGLEIYEVVNKIVKIIDSNNPKASYNIGFSAVCLDWISRLPVSVQNALIKLKLSFIKG